MQATIVKRLDSVAHQYSPAVLSSRGEKSDTETRYAVTRVLTGRILGLRKLDERPQSKAAHDCYNKTNAEHRHDLKLLLTGHVQLGEHR